MDRESTGKGERMSIRDAAEAVLEFLPTGDYSMWPHRPKAVVVTENLRAALAEPDAMAEACEIISALLPINEWCVNYGGLRAFPSEPISVDDIDRARKFLKRHGGAK